MSHLFVKDLEPGMHTVAESGAVHVGAFHKSGTLLSLTAGTMIQYVWKIHVKDRSKGHCSAIQR